MNDRHRHISIRLPVALVVGFALAATTIGWLRTARATPGRADAPTAHASAQTTGTVGLSEEQWASLDIRAATAANFSTIAVADAIVSVDEDATVPVFSPATGRLDGVHAQVGQLVRKGQLLATIAGSETSQAVSDLAAAAAQVRTTTQQLAQAHASLTRQRGLLDAGGGATKDLLQSQSDLTAAEGAKSSADAALEAARTKAAALGLDDPSQSRRLTSPIAGQVIQRQAAAGQFVGSLGSGSSTPLFTVSDLRHVWVVGGVAERDAGAVRVGQAVEILAPSSPKPVRASIAWVAPTVDAQSRRVQFRAEVANVDLALKPQMTARMRVLDAQAVTSTAIPSGAVIFDGQEAHCFVVSGQRQLTLRKLTIGRSDAGLTEVLAGLKAGDRVVARGAIFVDAMAEGAAS